jgi:hypothetical protein
MSLITSSTGQTYHPVVQLRIGGDDLVTIRPDHILTFRHTDCFGKNEVEMELVDPTYTYLENKFIGIDKEGSFRGVESRGLFQYRWGYPEQGFENAIWHSVELTRLSPRITHTGYFLNIAGAARNLCKASSLLQHKTYVGKVSEVAKQVALDLGYDEAHMDIEETADDERSDDPLTVLEGSGRGVTIASALTTKAVWPTSHMTLFDFVDRVLRVVARSKAHPNSPYKFSLTTDGYFIFSSYDNERPAVFNKNLPIRSFTMLYGSQCEDVVEFLPDYNTGALATRCRSNLSATYDPRTKRYIQSLIDRKELGLYRKDFDPDGAQTTAPPLSESTDITTKRDKTSGATYHPTKQVAMGGRCSGKQEHKHTGPEEALQNSKNRYMHLMHLISTATLTLVGKPEHANFSTKEMFCDVNPVMPDGTLHWSNGRYYIEKVVHDLYPAYKITVSLHRYTHAAGSANAKTPGYVAPAPTTVSST